jgi:ribosome-associated protein
MNFIKRRVNLERQNNISLDIIKVIYEALADKKAVNIRVIDISEISEIADFFVIAGGNNQSQVQALSDNVQEKLSEIDIKGARIEGYKAAEWILLDYTDFVVHIFNEEQRAFYELEKIWCDGNKINILEEENV